MLCLRAGYNHGSLGQEHNSRDGVGGLRSRKPIRAERCALSRAATRADLTARVGPEARPDGHAANLCANDRR